MHASGLHDTRCSGSVYLHVLASSMLIATIGLGSMYAVRIQVRSARLARDQAEARICAVSAVEVGLLQVRQDPNWRTTYSNGAWLENRNLGTGSFTLQGIDPSDGVLADSDYEPLVLTGIGLKGIARHKAQVTLVPVIEPLEALNMCLHASGRIHVKNDKRITVVGAPLSTNGQLRNDGTIDGSAQAQSIGHAGTITGVLTVPAPNKRMPDADLIARYADRATVIPYMGTINKRVLTPTCNPWGPTDPNGLYLIDTGGNDLTIKNSRIHGTLVVRTGGNALILNEAVFCRNYRSDFPTLIVEGDLTLKCSSAETMLSESANETNYNPLGAPYEGIHDSDMLDEYPNEVQGLVHIRGTLSLQQSSRVVGAVICEGAVHGERATTIIHDAGLYACPPNGYTYVSGMVVSPLSWRQVVD